MKLRTVNKSQYRKILNKAIFAFVAIFALLSLAFGTILIAIFTTPESTSNFKYNLAGVILALLFMAMIINQIRHKPWFADIYYVWQLKQIQNQIYRKLAKIKKNLNSDQPADKKQALVILSFYYLSLKFVYQLDDNTLTMSSVDKELERLASLAEPENLAQLSEQFEQQLLGSV